MPSYKNTSDRTILGIEPGETGEIDDASGSVGPGALERVGVDEVMKEFDLDVINAPIKAEAPEPGRVQTGGFPKP